MTEADPLDPERPLDPEPPLDPERAAAIRRRVSNAWTRPPPPMIRVEAGLVVLIGLLQLVWAAGVVVG